MANKGPSYGLSRRCQMKALAKFDLDSSREVLRWIEAVTGRNLTPAPEACKDSTDVQQAIKDGQALCELINRISPGAVKKINTFGVPFKEMENIEMFIKACRGYGMTEIDVFQTQDLYEGKTMYCVINCLYSLAALARKNGFSGPTIGVKLADKNQRNFTHEQLRGGEAVIGLQYGTNRGASQRGMTPYGATRKICDMK